MGAAAVLPHLSLVPPSELQLVDRRARKAEQMESIGAHAGSR
jgi:hypothetical protein